MKSFQEFIAESAPVFTKTNAVKIQQHHEGLASGHKSTASAYPDDSPLHKAHLTASRKHMYAAGIVKTYADGQVHKDVAQAASQAAIGASTLANSLGK